MKLSYAANVFVRWHIEHGHRIYATESQISCDCGESVLNAVKR